MSSGPSGPSIPRAQRKRPKTELSVSPRGLAALDALWTRHPGLTRPGVAERAWIYCQEQGIDLSGVEIAAPSVLLFVDGERSCVCCAALFAEGRPEFHKFGCPGENRWGNLALADWSRGHADAMRGLGVQIAEPRYRLGHKIGTMALEDLE